jgi:hypothetical protein
MYGGQFERVLSDANRLNYVLDRWIGEGNTNLETDWVQLAQFFLTAMLKMFYLRIQNIQLGYTLNSKSS